MAIDVLVTYSRGMEDFVRREMANLGVITMEMDGKMRCSVEESDIHKLEDNQLIERAFYCFDIHNLDPQLGLIASLKTYFSENFDLDKFVTFMKRVLNNASGGDYANKRRRASLDPLLCHLYVKLRPKKLIKLTEVVRKLIVSELREIELNTDAKNCISFNVSEDRLFILVHFTKIQSARHAHKSYHRGLRRTIASAMTSCVKPGIVIDPFVGSGGLIGKIVCARTQSASFAIGCDRSIEALADAKIQLGHERTYDLVRCNAEKLPFRKHTFDALVADMPFGKQHKTFIEGRETKPLDSFLIWIDIMKNVLIDDGRFSILLPRAEAQALCQQVENWDLSKKVNIQLGETEATLLVGNFIVS